MRPTRRSGWWRGAALAAALQFAAGPLAVADDPDNPLGSDPEPPPEEPPVEEPVNPLGSDDPPPDEPPPDVPAPPPPVPEKPAPPPDGTDPEAPPPDEIPPEEPAEPDPEEVARAEAEKQSEEAKKLEKEMIQKAEAFASQMRKTTTTDDEREKLIATVSFNKHPKIAEALIPYMKADVTPVKVRETAIAALKSQKFPVVAAAALANFDPKSSDLKYQRAMLEIVGRTGNSKSLSRLKAVMKDEAINQEYCKSAIQAIGAIGHRDAIPDLISLLQRVSAPSWPASKAARKQAIQKPLEQALKDITKVEMPSVDMWKMWWKENEKTFQKE